MNSGVKNEADFEDLSALMSILMKCEYKKGTPVNRWYQQLCEDFDFLGRGNPDFSFLGYLDECEIEKIRSQSHLYHRQNPLANVTEAIHESLLKYDWSETLRVLQQVTSSRSDVLYVIWKVGCEVISHEQDRSMRCALMQDFYQKMSKQPGLHVVLDYVLFAICNGDREYAKSTLQEVATQKKPLKTEKDLYEAELLNAYHGYVMYLEWKDGLKQMVTLEQGPDLDNSFQANSQEQFIGLQTNEYAMKALRLFRGVEDLDGVWDIFVEKYVEILLFLDKNQDAMYVVKEYSHIHPDNLYAQKFFYRFLTMYYPEAEDGILKQLQAIVDLNPADQLVMEYCKQVQDASKIISSLFTMLDYPVWQDEVKPWAMMALCLERICIDREEGTEDAKTTVEECWKIRSEWWPSFHFTKYVANKDSTDNNKLLMQKYIVNAILCGQDNDFSVVGRKKLAGSKMCHRLKKVAKYHKLGT